MLQELINGASNDLLSKQVGHVFQIWDDGEITMQKSGDLLWQRSLHTMKPDIGKVFELDFPHKRGVHSFAYVTNENAIVIREEMKKELILEIQGK